MKDLMQQSGGLLLARAGPSKTFILQSKMQTNPDISVFNGPPLGGLFYLARYSEEGIFTHFLGIKVQYSKTKKAQICGFPLRFPLLIDGAYKLLHSGSTVPLHLIGNMSVYIKGKRSSRMA